MQKNRLKAILFAVLCCKMPGIVRSKCSSAMGKQIIHCSYPISSIRELNEEIDSTTSIIVLRDLEDIRIDPEEHMDQNFEAVTSYQLSRIKYLDLAENAFLGLKSFLILKIANSDIGILRNNFFKGVRSLEILELINCNIAHIEDKAFAGLSNLQSLDLTNSSIKRISKPLFQDVSNLNYLALYKNEINTIEVDSFKYLTKLTTLGLSANHLKVINTETFNVLRKLTYLYVSFNRIENIIGDFKCINLKFINFHRNNLKSISRTLFKSCINLVDTDLAFNNLNYIDECAFDNLPNLMNLHLRNCTADISKLKFISKPLIVL